MLKENGQWKKEVDFIRNKFGTNEEIEESIKMAKLKEQKVFDLLNDLDHNLKSTENQLSCYKCSGILNEPIL